MVLLSVLHFVRWINSQHIRTNPPFNWSNSTEGRRFSQLMLIRGVNEFGCFVVIIIKTVVYNYNFRFKILNKNNAKTLSTMAISIGKGV